MPPHLLPLTSIPSISGLKERECENKNKFNKNDISLSRCTLKIPCFSFPHRLTAGTLPVQLPNAQISSHLFPFLLSHPVSARTCIPDFSVASRNPSFFSFYDPPETRPIFSRGSPPWPKCDCSKGKVAKQLLL